MEKRYARSAGALLPEELNKIKAAGVCVAGCGGLGCYVVEELSRLGIGKITVVDGDVFEETNLNRQLYCDEAALGKSKVQAAARRIASVNSGVEIRAVEENLTDENADELLRGCSLAIDALDSPRDRKLLAKACAEVGIPLVHGAISGWRAQISVLAPGSDAFEFMYPEDAEQKSPPSLAFTPAVAASLEVAEAVKLIIGRGRVLDSKLLIIDILTQEYNEIKL